MTEAKHTEAKQGTGAMLAKKNMGIIAAVFVLLGATGAGYAIYQGRQDNSEEAVAQRNLDLSQRVLGSLKDVLLLSDDLPEPSVAAVSDVELLRQDNADFYKDVQNGDYIVIYPSQAIIFREQENKIINIAPIISNQGAGQAEQPSDN